MARPSRARGCRKQETARRPARGSRKQETMARPSRAGQKRSRAREKKRLNKIWPSFINLPWDLWASSINSAGCPPMAATGSPAHGAKDAAIMGDAVIMAKPNRNIAVMGREAAFDLAVAEGEIDGEMQKWVTNKAFGELAAFEFFSNSAREDGSRRFPKGGSSARTAWQKLRSHERGWYRDAVTPTIARELFEQFDARKATPLYKLSKLTRLSEGKYGMSDE